ncbi:MULTISPECIES: DUF3099 domain-containing protein [unclassified Streptomyces]|uniref:DUF3099 domain-containing protein n=1 Tax=unclassified Streptomyces TaxID=2593676 RepID=UPI0022B742B2|nr:MULTISPECIES: DUF3099 domain-containing protein [unclassified Streptomyces]MCZ7416044.1 DUF3099 domain-containing protein [Streptomyces sp. WMMC897]MCZ7434149.1 DUF3099 domain-containing protein [Streptomyces sp. WMMC1477]
MAGRASPGGRPPTGSQPKRERRYFALMALCLALFVSAWAFVRLFSVPLAIGMSVVAALIPPVAVVVANLREESDHWFDEGEDEDGDEGGGEDEDGDGAGGR